MTTSRALLLLVLATSACGRTHLDADLPDSGPRADGGAGAPDGSVGTPATTTLTPPPGIFQRSVEVTLSTDRPATLSYTTDGSDPKTSPTRKSGSAPQTLTLEATTTLTFFSRTPEGAEEPVRTATYVRKGAKGSVSGTVVIGALAVGRECGVSFDSSTLSLGKPAAAGEVPFLIEGLGTGSHRLVPYADTNGDGVYLPVVDMSGAEFTFELDLADPARSSLEGVKLFLGASKPGLCTIQGNVKFTGPVPNQSLSVAALDPAAMQGGVDPQTLLAAFGSGYRVTTNATETVYPYAIYDLAPGDYLPVPALLGSGAAFSINLVADLGGIRSCAEGETVSADFEFGQVSLTGKVTYTPATPALFAYGAVAGRSISISPKGISAQVLIMPLVLVASSTGDLGGNVGAKALRDGQTFDLRAFTNLDGAGTATGALTAAFSWALNPFAPEKAHATVVATPPQVTATLQAP